MMIKHQTHSRKAFQARIAKLIKNSFFFGDFFSFFLVFGFVFVQAPYPWFWWGMFSSPLIHSCLAPDCLIKYLFKFCASPLIHWICMEQQEKQSNHSKRTDSVKREHEHKKKLRILSSCWTNQAILIPLMNNHVQRTHHCPLTIAITCSPMERWWSLRCRKSWTRATTIVGCTMLAWSDLCPHPPHPHPLPVPRPITITTTLRKRPVIISRTVPSSCCESLVSDSGSGQEEIRS